MKQFPNHKKYRKNHLIYYRKLNKQEKSFYLKYSNIGIQSKNTLNLNFRQLDSGRKILKKILKKRGNLIVKVYPWVSRTKKSAGMRMGKGKGNKRE
jgi:large subunit ribosomal protein L16